MRVRAQGVSIRLHSFWRVSDLRWRLYIYVRVCVYAAMIRFMRTFRLARLVKSTWTSLPTWNRMDCSWLIFGLKGAWFLNGCLRPPFDALLATHWQFDLIQTQGRNQIGMWYLISHINTIAAGISPQFCTSFLKTIRSDFIV